MRLRLDHAPTIPCEDGFPPPMLASGGRLTNEAKMLTPKRLLQLLLQFRLQISLTNFYADAYDASFDFIVARRYSTSYIHNILGCLPNLL